jgi:hypothetical protein
MVCLGGGTLRAYWPILCACHRARRWWSAVGVGGCGCPKPNFAELGRTGLYVSRQISNNFLAGEILPHSGGGAQQFAPVHIV